MRAHAAVGALVVASLGCVASTWLACDLDLPDVQSATAPVNVEAGPPPADASSSSGVVAEAAAPAKAFCETHTATLCDDFSDATKALPRAWTETNTKNGSVVLKDGALVATVNDGNAVLSKDYGMASDQSIEASVRVDALPGGKSLAVLALRFKGAFQDDPVSATVDASKDGTSLVMRLSEPASRRDVTLDTTPFKIGDVKRVRLRLIRTPTTATASLSIDDGPSKEITARPPMGGGSTASSTTGGVPTWTAASLYGTNAKVSAQAGASGTGTATIDDVLVNSIK